MALGLIGSSTSSVSDHGTLMILIGVVFEAFPLMGQVAFRNGMQLRLREIDHRSLAVSKDR